MPHNSNIIGYGVGPAKTGQTTGILEMSIEGIEGDLNGIKCKLVGAGSKLTSGTSAYIYLDNGIPDLVAFGLANEAFGMPTQMEFQKLK